MDTLEQLMFKVPFFSFGMITVEKCFCGFIGDFPMQNQTFSSTLNTFVSPYFEFHYN